MMPGLSTLMLQGSDLVSGLNASVSPTKASKSAGSTSGASLLVTSNTVTAAASGGSGSYSYAWALFSGDASIAATSAATAATAFSATLAPGDIAVGTWRITVTDTVTGGKAHADVDVSLHYVDLR